MTKEILIQYCDLKEEAKDLGWRIEKLEVEIERIVMKNFFGLLKTEMFYKHNFDSISHFIEELEKYIEYYDNKRIKFKLNGMSPVQFRTHSSKVA